MKRQKKRLMRDDGHSWKKSVGMAAGLGVSEDAEAFGALSDEEFGEYVEKFVIPEEFGDPDWVKKVLKAKYATYSPGQKRIFTMTAVCHMGGVPTLTKFNSDTGAFGVRCE
jgi:hypothetical protein